MKKNWIISAILVIAVLSLFSVANASNQYSTVVDETLSEVTSLYTEYYTISNASADVIKTETNENGDTVITINASFQRTLKAKSADEMPYVRGLEAALAELSEEDQIEVATQYINALKKDLNDNYIGVAQDTEVPLVVTVPSVRPMGIGTDTLSVSFVGMEEIFPVETLKPLSYDELEASGELAIEGIVTNSVSMRNASMFRVNSVITQYDRIKARDYARNWSCQSGSNVEHSSCHNSEYSFFDYNDCANFVSQAFVAGGLPTDSTWKRGTAAWQGAISLPRYLTSNNLFFNTTNEYKAFAGSVVNWLDEYGANAGHVGIVDQNDTQTMTFCAHTACRNHCPWSGEPVDFYVPYWDSYSNQWTQQ